MKNPYALAAGHPAAFALAAANYGLPDARSVEELVEALAGGGEDEVEEFEQDLADEILAHI